MTLTAGPLRYIVFGLICAGTFAIGVAGALLHDDQRITEGVYIEQLHVGGLTPAEAQARLERELLPTMPRQLELRSGTSRWLVGNDKLGRRALLQETLAQAYAMGRDGGLLQRARTRLTLAHKGRSLPLPVAVDRDRAEAIVTELAQRIDRLPVDARVSNVIAGQPYFAPEQDGLRVNVSATVAAITAQRRFPPPAAVPMVVEIVPPKVRAAALQGDLNAVIATFRTNMADGYYGVMRENRAHNVRLLVERMKGRILLPGEEWSFNNDLGERRAEDGFRSSIVFMRKPDGTIEERWSTGGGICQLATTIFNAALYANLTITQRGNHSKTVHYARIGRDATVYYGVVDLKFRNTLRHPVLLWGELLPNYDLVITVIGHRDDDTEVDLTSDSWAGRTGQGGSLWRTVRSLEGRVLKDREHICNSFYPYEAKVTSAAD